GVDPSHRRACAGPRCLQRLDVLAVRGQRQAHSDRLSAPAPARRPRVMRPLAGIAATLLVALATSGCSLIWWPDDIKPGDSVKTPEEAIALAMHGCGSVVPDTDPDHWDAHLEADLWHVHWSHRQSDVSARIAKADGTFYDCDVNLVPE